MKTAFSSQRRYYTILFVITKMAAVTLRVNQHMSNAIFLIVFSGQNLTTPNIVGRIMLGFVASVCTWLKV